MIRVRELLELEPFAEFELITGAAGLDNGVTSFAVLDYEIESGDFSAFINGEFVISSLLLMKELTAKAVAAVQSLLERGVSAIAVRAFESTSIPEDMTQMCDAAGVALFVFRKAFVNDIFIAANDYAQTRQRHELAARRLDELLGLPGEGSSPAALVREIDPSLLSCCTAVFALNDHAGDAGGAAMLRLMERYSGHETGGARRTYIPYSGGLLLLFSSNTLEGARVTDEAIILALRDIGIDPGKRRVGVGGAAEGYDEYALSITEAVRAAKASAGNAPMRFGDAGALRLIGALSQDRSAMRLCREAVSIIEGYDRTNSAELLETLCEYIRRRGDVRATAERLFQHPNTIRYRLKKAASLLGLEGDVYEQLFMIINAYLIGRDDTKQ